MNCELSRMWLGAFVDQELSATEEVELRRHLNSCLDCRAEVAAMEAVRSAVERQERYTASSEFQARLKRAIPRESQPDRRAMLPWLGAFALGFVFAAVCFFGVSRLQSEVPSIEGEIVSSHVRSLMPGHLTDIVSSNRHTVKPWFAGRVDSAPPTFDFKDRGFALVGGRLDYVDHRSTAVLVYRCREHVLNLFLLATTEHLRSRATNIKGYHLMEWSTDGLSYILISDVDQLEMTRFVSLYRSEIERSSQ